jgi:N-formylglutamate amidohydrolase
LNAPVILHIPHASARIPEREARRLSIGGERLHEELLRMTDWYTDELFEHSVPGAVVVRFPVSRLVVDPERFPDDGAEPMARVGMGAVYTRCADGTELRRPPSPAERQRLLDAYYVPHHRALTEAVARMLSSHERCLVLDCHSFPSAPLPYEPDQSPDRPDICLGSDAFHTPEGLIRAAREAFGGAGLRVRVDSPFAGSLVPLEHYRSDERVSALMVEVNRSLYMDEETGSRLPGFEEFVCRLGEHVRECVSAWQGSGTGS